VPSRYPGAGRLVYPGFLQHAGFVAMNPDRHLKSHYEFYLHLLRGDDSDAEAHRRFYDEYNAVLDMPARFYLDTIRIVFQEFRLPRGTWSVDGERVDPAAIRKTALLTIEGELDDISGQGQTHAAHGLCANLSPSMRELHTAADCGHYGIFSGRRWRQQICPKISSFIRAHA
jgi:poly(3-hydroxybutyrate) depolymerase